MRPALHAPPSHDSLRSTSLRGSLRVAARGCGIHYFEPGRPLSLRATTLEHLLQQRDPSAAVEVLEAAVAGATDASGEPIPILRRIAAVHRQRGNALGEAYALRRILVHAPADPATLTRLSEVLPALGDERALARVLSLRLASETDAASRRETYLLLAAVQAHGRDFTAASKITLDRVRCRAWANRLPEARADLVRALCAMGAYQLAVEHLLEWAKSAGEDRMAPAMYGAAARILRLQNENPRKSLAVLRTGLAQQPEAPELLLLAGKKIAAQSKAIEPMMEIYATLDDVAAGEHGRNALAYRRAAFLAAAGDREDALAAFLELFEKNPLGGSPAHGHREAVGPSRSSGRDGDGLPASGRCRADQ